jgi:hypothetical protein
MDYGLAIAVLPLFLGVISTQFLRIPLRGFVGLYLLLVAANVAVTYIYLAGGIIAPLLIGALGFLVMMVVAGAFGTRVRTSDLALAAMTFGLFPWNIVGLIPSIVYLVVAAGLVLLVALRPKFNNPFQRRFKR